VHGAGGSISVTLIPRPPALDINPPRRSARQIEALIPGNRREISFVRESPGEADNRGTPGNDISGESVAQGPRLFYSVACRAAPCVGLLGSVCHEKAKPEGSSAPAALEPTASRGWRMPSRESSLSRGRSRAFGFLAVDFSLWISRCGFLAVVRLKGRLIY
jgi:hypothetical protein